MGRGCGDHGQVGGIEAVPFGVLIFVVGALLCANAWAVVDAKLAVDAAAREATRAYVESAGRRSADEEAVAAGREAIAAHGRDPDRADIHGSARFARCARATFTVSYDVPALTLPWIGGYGDGFTVTSHHTELVDPYRSGIPGDATSC